MISLTEHELSVVQAILLAHLPGDVSVHVFGSRAHRQPKPWSDLDLLLEAPARLPLSLVAKLAEAFEESELPWKVDLVDRKAVSKAFGKLIDQTKIAIP